ncbi:hypothetical protein A5821_003412 [Enterococcus sp. 7F3_DIV0205]|uniref:MucBP domain-containing protein n=1 Tax=Candidatus Enterococcus palustris TaxID=1834189 RepID=A0AAQ3WCE0_9ENTE|nr:MucBP domain-containing protein [Enterococcus sp. 7F3_DIV0205]OTN84294.1 hypothetical protein A5821_000220 [Enterococcus sp. 7F3_DIV0205]
MPLNHKGVFQEEAQEVLYLYETIRDEEQGTVVVKHQDLEGRQLAGESRMSGVPGSNYETSAQLINGYRVVHTPANALGTFALEEQTVIYLYDLEEPTEPIEPEEPTESETPITPKEPEDSEKHSESTESIEPDESHGKIGRTEPEQSKESGKSTNTTVSSKKANLPRTGEFLDRSLKYNGILLIIILMCMGTISKFEKRKHR